MRSIAFALAIFAVSSAHAEWKPQYADASQATRDWYASAQVTDAAFPRLGFRGCCVSSEVVRTKFMVSKVGSKDEWSYLDPVSQTWKIVPSDIVHWAKPHPMGARRCSCSPIIGPMRFICCMARRVVFTRLPVAFKSLQKQKGDDHV